MPRVLVVTGAVGAGKSRLLARLARDTRRHWRLGGCVARGEGRGAEGPAARYWLEPPAGGPALPWAERRAGGDGFSFSQDALERTAARVRAELAGGAELVLLDELGRLELAGGGLAPLAREVLASRAAVVVLALRRDALAGLISTFGLEEAEVADLDRLDAREARLLLLRGIRAGDAGRIGVFAGMGGLVEVGLGSVLHAWHVPLKGHLLAYLQNLTLASFGKALNGRGLARISLIEALLKAFSPMGKRLMPMLYILLQGLAFAAPVALLGWNLAAVLLGSVLMAWLTLGLWVLTRTLMFGAGFLAALAVLVESVGGVFGAHWTLRGGALWILGLKAAVALAVGTAVWRGDPLTWLRRRLPRRAVDGGAPQPAGRASWGARAWASGRDLLRWRFLLAYLVSLLLILFFARLGPADLATVALRGLCLAYLGFLLLRSLDLHALAGWLDRKAGLGLAASLPRALEVLRGERGAD